MLGFVILKSWGQSLLSQYACIAGLVADWKVFQLLTREFGYKEAFNFHNPKEIFNKYKAMSKLNGYMDIDKAGYDTLYNSVFIWDKISKSFYPFNGPQRDQWHKN